MPTPITMFEPMFEPMPYAGYVRQDWVAAAKQNSAFLNDRSTEPFSMGMFEKDLKRTVEFAETNVSRAVAANIISEARRFFGDETNLW